jgi:hypothetical protein
VPGNPVHQGVAQVGKRREWIQVDGDVNVGYGSADHRDPYGQQEFHGDAKLPPGTGRRRPAGLTLRGTGDIGGFL